MIPPNRAGSVYGDDAARDPEPGDHKQHRQRTARRRQQRTESRTVADRRQTTRRAGRPLVEEARQRPQGAHQTRQAAARPNVCAVTRAHARSCSRTPAAASATCGAQPNCVPLRGHQTLCEAVKITCKPQTNRTPGAQGTPRTTTGDRRLTATGHPPQPPATATGHSHHTPTAQPPPPHSQPAHSPSSPAHAPQPPSPPARTPRQRRPSTRRW